MASRTGSGGQGTPDLFSASQEKLSPSSAPKADEAKPSAQASRHVLPNDLPAAIRHLDDFELDQLQAAVTAEQQQRGKTSAQDIRPTKPAAAAAVSLKPGKMNAVRASFQAGVTPAKIAKQFGVPQAEVRKAIASITAKVKP